MSDVAITEGTPADLADACALWFLADEGPAADVAQRQVDVQRLVDGLQEVWQGPPAHLLLATMAARLVGTVFAKPRRNDQATGQISMLAVHPEWQRRGIGGRLIDAALAALADDGCRRCQIYVAAGDRPVQDFYEKRGWTFTGRVQPSPDTGEDELIYRREPIR